MNARGRLSAALMACLMGLITACGGTDSLSSDAAEAPRAAADEENVGGEGLDGVVAGQLEIGEGDVVAQGETASGALGNQPDAARKIIRTGDVTIRVEDVAAAADEVTALLAGAGAVLFSEDTSLEFNPRSSLVFKIPPGEFDRAVDLLGPVGTIVGQQASSTDVTERVLDLQSRISTAETSVDRLRTFLADATTVTDVAALETELLARETTLETLRAEVRNIESQVSQSTLRVDLFSDEPPAEFNTDDDLPGFLGGLSAGWGALVAFLAVLSAIVGFLIPFVPFIAAAIGLLIWLRRRAARRRVERAKTPAVVGAQVPPAPTAARPAGPTAPPPPRANPAQPVQPQRSEEIPPPSPSD